MTRYLAAIDLGKTKVGWSLWYVDGDEVRALVGRGTVRAPGRSPPRNVASRVREAVCGALNNHPLLGRHNNFLEWVCEWPMKYPDKTKYHKDLDALYAVGDSMEAAGAVWSVKYRPGAWKGNVPKAIHHRRLATALHWHLVQHPIVPFSEHDTWDAIGIGAFHLGLTKRGGVV